MRRAWWWRWATASTTARGPARLADTDRAALRGLQRGRDWIWIAGNHDPEPAEGIGGRFLATLALGALTFRHEPVENAGGEIAGHLHPVARVARRGRAVSRRCFACDGERLVMPAFGAYAGGLNVRDRAFAQVFQHAGLHRAHAGRAAGLCRRRQALPAGLSNQSRRNTTLANQPVKIAIIAVVRP